MLSAPGTQAAEGWKTRRVTDVRNVGWLLSWVKAQANAAIGVRIVETTKEYLEHLGKPGEGHAFNI